jgi:hypothetical protein
MKTGGFGPHPHYKDRTMTLTGRPATFAFILITGIASACLNCFGAFSLFNGVAAWIFLAAIFGMEGLALLALKHIVQDWQNHHRIKAALATLIFIPLVIGCAASGKRAFDMLAIDLRETNKIEMAKAERIQARADEHFAAAAKATERSTQLQEISRGELEQAKADAIRLQVEKKAAPPAWLVICLLCLFELVKTGGRYAIATETAKTWSPARRRAANVTNLRAAA